MKIEMGESLFYSWLRHYNKCQIVQTNWKTSSKWYLQHEAKLNKIKDEADKLFKKKYKFSVFKKIKSLSQLLQQAECDNIGMSLNDRGKLKIIAVDVAFHEAGLNYKGPETTVMKVINKSLRTAMCVYGYLDVKDATIIFASPKISKKIMEKLEKCFGDMQKLIRELGCQFKFEIIANEKFLNRVLYPTLLASDKVSDTSELFLRSYRMLQMFSGIKFSMQDMNLDDYKIGELANTMFKGIIENTNISEEEIKNLLDKKYSKEKFNIDYPVLVKTGEKHDKYDKNRYYKDPIIFGKKQYLLCNNWIERTNKEYLLNWIKDKYK